MTNSSTIKTTVTTTIKSSELDEHIANWTKSTSSSDILKLQTRSTLPPEQTDLVNREEYGQIQREIEIDR